MKFKQVNGYCYERYPNGWVVRKSYPSYRESISIGVAIFDYSNINNPVNKSHDLADQIFPDWDYDRSGPVVEMNLSLDDAYKVHQYVKNLKGE